MTFSFKATPKGTVFIEKDGERVKTLRADRARRFLALANSTDRTGELHRGNRRELAPRTQFGRR